MAARFQSRIQHDTARLRDSHRGLIIIDRLMPSDAILRPFTFLMFFNFATVKCSVSNVYGGPAQRSPLANVHS